MGQKLQCHFRLPPALPVVLRVSDLLQRLKLCSVLSTASALVVSAPALRELAQTLPARLAAGASSAYLLFGWFKHGGKSAGLVPPPICFLEWWGF